MDACYLLIYKQIKTAPPCCGALSRDGVGSALLHARN
jgi:hypothetical protein